MDQTKDIVEKAEIFATNAHQGQARWGGDPYIDHPRRIVARLRQDINNSSEMLAAAWLHDVLEATQITEVDLYDAGFPEAVVLMVERLTKDPMELYADYIVRLRDSNDVDAIKIKLADLADNMSDLKEGSMKDKYRLAAVMLRERLQLLGV